MISRNTGRELGQEDRRDDERDHVAEVAQNQWPATASLVDEQDRAELGDQRDDTVDALVFEGVVARNT